MKFLDSPVRNLVWIAIFMIVMMAFATLAYMAAGWGLRDAFYMVVITVYSVGFQEVRPVDTPYLLAVTVSTIILGCTGMILLTSALVQFLTLTQLQQIFGLRRVQTEIDRLRDHTIIAGFGRIGSMVARELSAGAATFIVIESDEKRVADARSRGYLCLHADATDEITLRKAGVERARGLATVLANDAANVFITLSARSMNANVEIIARGESPTTERKLMQAGANKVVLPAHIGAERIAEMILFPGAERVPRSTEHVRARERALRELGLEMEVVVAAEHGAMTNLTVAQIEAHAGGRFFIYQLNRRDGDVINEPEPNLRVAGGDGVVIVGRVGRDSRALFDAPIQ